MGREESLYGIALRVYESMLYDIVFKALPEMLSKLVGEGGFIGTFMVISSASEHVFRMLAEKLGGGSLDFRKAAEMMRVMAEVHNKFSENLLGVTPVRVNIVSDNTVRIECELSDGQDATPVVFMGLVGGFLRALGFTVKPLKSDSGIRFLKPGELGIVARSEGSRCIVEVVRR